MIPYSLISVEITPGSKGLGLGGADCVQVGLDSLAHACTEMTETNDKMHAHAPTTRAQAELPIKRSVLKFALMPQHSPIERSPVLMTTATTVHKTQTRASLAI